MTVFHSGRVRLTLDGKDLVVATDGGVKYRFDAVTVEGELADLKQDALRYKMLRDLLEEQGCRFPEGVPPERALADFLTSLRSRDYLMMVEDAVTGERGRVLGLISALVDQQQESQGVVAHAVTDDMGRAYYRSLEYAVALLNRLRESVKAGG